MILARSALKEVLASGDLKINDDNGDIFPGFKLHGTHLYLSGFATENPKVIEPASIDLHLGDHWLVPKPNNVYKSAGKSIHFADSRKPVDYTETFSSEYMVPANGFVLARTQECIHIAEHLTAWIEGRSSFGRFGFFVQNAGWTDPGFQGSITLEIYNALPHPALLISGTPCCQLVVSEVVGDAEGGYQGSYQGQKGTKGSMLYKTVPGGEG